MARTEFEINSIICHSFLIYFAFRPIMKLFGKRSRENAGNGGNQSVEENRDKRAKVYFDSTEISNNTRVSFDASPTKEITKSFQNKGEKNVKSAIDQIIYKDLHSLNSKQRRHLKRHRNREIEHMKETHEMISDKSSIEVVLQCLPDDNGRLVDAHSRYRYKGNDSAVITASITDDSIDPGIAEPGDVQKIDNTREGIAPEAELLNKQGREASCFCATFGSSHERKSIQDALNIDPAKRNSKQRRLVKRYHERGGDVLSNQIERGKWSHLPDEERKRREKQRQMQKEAAKRRAMDASDAPTEMSSMTDKRKRHPLNSERRRANRRKPKRVRQLIAKKRD